ncbi:MAG: glycosyltransferase family 9 protein [Candidatus Altiarchaeota archaeon]
MKVFFFPSGDNHSSKIGDNIIYTAQSLALRKRFRNAHVTVATALPEIYFGMDGIAGSKEMSQSQVFSMEGPGLLLVDGVGMEDCLDQKALKGFLNRGNQVINLGADKSVLYSNGVSATDRIVFKSNLPAAALDGISQRARTEMLLAGIEARQTPRIHLTREETSRAHEIIRACGVTDLGKCKLIFYSNNAVSDPTSILDIGSNMDVVRSCTESDYSVLVNTHGMKLQNRLFKGIDGVYNMDHLGLREMFAVIDACDLVVSANSGPMWAAAALGRPAIGYFGMDFLIQKWCPEGINVLPALSDSEAISAGIKAMRLLQSGRAHEVFVGGKGAVNDSHEYVRLLRRLDGRPAEATAKDIDEAFRLRAILQGDLKAEFRRFFRSSELFFQKDWESPSSITFCHLQTPLYRYMAQAFERDAGKKTFQPAFRG